LFWTKILDIKRKSEGEYTFTVKLQARTFEHAHSSPIGIETITMDVSPFGVKIINFEHKGDEWEQKIEQFNKELLNDIIKTFNLDLTYFKKYEYRQLEYLAEQGNDNFVSIHNIIEEIVKELNKDIKPPYKNFINPFTFVKDDKAYILFKKADGTNFVYTFKKNDNTWIVIKKESKQGKKMPKELLWYMYKHLIYIMLGSITMR
jgi:hypothetical protein